MDVARICLLHQTGTSGEIRVLRGQKINQPIRKKKYESDCFVPIEREKKLASWVIAGFFALLGPRDLLSIDTSLVSNLLAIIVMSCVTSQFSKVTVHFHIDFPPTKRKKKNLEKL